MKCDRCKKDFCEHNIQEHHIHPKFMDNPKGDGKKFYLCEKCHNILHLIIPSIIWKYVVLKREKERCINEVLGFTKRWCR